MLIKNNKKSSIVVLFLFFITAFKCERSYEYENFKKDMILKNETQPNNNATALLGDCQASDISLGLVANCGCRSGINDCRRCISQSGALLNVGLIACNTVCGSDNRECHGCDIWYGGVCECLKSYPLPNTVAGCYGNTPWQGPGNGLPPVWILRNSANLISSTVLNTGIENLNQMPVNNEGWLLGLAHINTATQALAMNSVNTRTRNEIHIHLCNKNNAVSSYLGTQAASPNFAPFAIPGTTTSYCKTTQNGMPITPSSDFVNWVAQNPSANINTLGIGVLTDTHNNYIWTCISTSGVAEFIFC